MYISFPFCVILIWMWSGANKLTDNLPVSPNCDVMRCVQPKEPLDKCSCSDYYVHCLLMLAVSDKLKYSTVIG